MNLRILHTGFTIGLDEHLHSLGHTMDPRQPFDAVILMSISKLDDLRDFDTRVPLYVYDWDLYPHFVKQNTYQWDFFAKVKRYAKEVWVPSNEVALRNSEIYGIKHCIIVRSFARLFQAETTMGDYIFHGMREYSWDPQNGWLKRACEELGIPLVSPDHSLSDEEYRKAVAGCRFAVCEYEEASTGGLTLIEAHALGKPVLFCDSKYMGAADYFGERGTRFKTGDYADFKEKVAKLYAKTPELDKAECWEWAQQFTLEETAKAMHERLTI